MGLLDDASKIIIFDIFSVDDNSIFLTIFLSITQLLILAVYLLPLKGKLLNEMLSKWITTFMYSITTLPSIILSIHLIINEIQIGPNIILFVLSLLTTIISETMQI
jgi:hypothetical protein